MNYQALQEAIATAIKTNGEGEITGAILQSVLQSIVSIVGANYQYMGVATTSTNPGTPAGSVFYLTSTAGTYTNFNNIVVEDGKLTALMWDSTAWSKSEIADLGGGGGNVDYDVISGANVQLKDENDTPIYPKTNLEMVEGFDDYLGKYMTLTGRPIGTNGNYNYGLSGYHSILVPYMGNGITAKGITFYSTRVFYYTSSTLSSSTCKGYTTIGNLLNDMTDVKYAVFSYADTEDASKIIVIQDNYLINRGVFDKWVKTTKNILCIGDSLTGNSYGGWVKTIGDWLGANYEVTPIGIPGEHIYTTCARCGGINAFITSQVTLPADTSTVAIGTQMSEGTHEIKPVNLSETSGVLYNPVMVNGVECEISLTSSTYYLKRKVAGTGTMVINTDEPLIFSTTKNYINADNFGAVIWIGTNSNELSYDATEITNAIDKIISALGLSRYIVMGVYRTSFTLEKLEALEAQQNAKYGSHYINFRRYAIEHGFEVTGLTPTAEDTTAMNNGFVPPSFLNSDGIHLNSDGVKIVVKVLEDRMSALGWT